MKSEVDKVQKDKDHNKYPSDFRIELSINHTNSVTHGTSSFPSQHTLVNDVSNVSSSSMQSAKPFRRRGKSAPRTHELELVEINVP